MKRIAAFAGTVLLAAAFGAGVAAAHATLDKTSVPGNTDIDITVNAPVEEVVGYNDKLVLTVPDGFRVLSCLAPAGYTCTMSNAASPPRTLVTWIGMASGQELVTPTEQFPLRIRTTSSAGKYKFVVDQHYSNGNEAHWNGAEGSANPAPVLSVDGADPPAVTNTTVPAPEPTPDSAPSFFSPIDSPPFTPAPFEGTTDTTAVINAPPTTEATTNTSAPDLAITTTANEGGAGIAGAERVILLGLAIVAVGAASITTLRQRGNR